MVLVDGVPFLQLNFCMISASLCGDKLLEISNSVIRAAFNSDFASKTIVSYDFDKSHFADDSDEDDLAGWHK